MSLAVYQYEISQFSCNLNLLGLPSLPSCITRTEIGLFSDPHSSILVHPLTTRQREDHETRNAWMGTPWPIYLDSLPRDGPTPLQYPELGLGWSTSPIQEISLEERRKRGAEVEKILANDAEAAPAPKD